MNSPDFMLTAFVRAAGVASGLLRNNTPLPGVGEHVAYRDDSGQSIRSEVLKKTGFLSRTDDGEPQVAVFLELTEEAEQL